MTRYCTSGARGYGRWRRIRFCGCEQASQTTERQHHLPGMPQMHALEDLYNEVRDPARLKPRVREAIDAYNAGAFRAAIDQYVGRGEP